MSNNLHLVKKDIVENMKRIYGFAPKLKDIRPLESCEDGDFITWLGFDINGVGYEWNASHYANERVYKSESYDMK